jgi:Rrf2 family transcriptional regulator, iron-sulfur cluster assembly transcription factor
MELLKRNTDYALRALVHMAAFGTQDMFRMGDLAKATGAPETFLRKVMQKLDAAGVVITRRGSGGGVSFGKTPDLISVLEVMEAIQGPVAVNKCFVANRECDDRTGCAIRRNLGTIQDDMVNLFRTATVASLAAGAAPIKGN